MYHHHSCPSTRSRICLLNCALPIPGTADGDVVSRWQALGRADSVHHGGQPCRCCMVCLMPQSQVSCSLENPHFNMFTLDRPTCVRSRLSAFLVVQGFSVPAGRCSSALMLRCTLASRSPSRSFHSSKRAAFAVVLKGLSACHKALPRFEAWHHCEMSIE